METDLGKNTNFGMIIFSLTSRFVGICDLHQIPIYIWGQLVFAGDTKLTTQWVISLYAWAIRANHLCEKFNVYEKYGEIIFEKPYFYPLSKIRPRWQSLEVIGKNPWNE